MNPKDKLGDKKVSTWLIPFGAIYHMALAFMDGARKYGPFNWRDEPVHATIYLDAIQRHLALWTSKQENAEDSGVHHLGHVMGCCAILLDAQLHDTLVDDRRPSPQFVNMLGAMNDFVKERSEPKTLYDSIVEAQQKSFDVMLKGLRQQDLITQVKDVIPR